MACACKRALAEMGCVTVMARPGRPIWTTAGWPGAAGWLASMTTDPPRYSQASSAGTVVDVVLVPEITTVKPWPPSSPPS